MTVLVVESPAKAKTINKYLGADFRVLASYGHVRDLPSKDGSVRPDEDFDMSWEVDGKSKKRIDEIAKALKGDDTLILATDPDREGEAISWHVEEVLRQRKALKDVNVSRVVLHEITKDAILEAMKQPRAINQELVDAYLARRALDYLVGFYFIACPLAEAAGFEIGVAVSNPSHYASFASEKPRSRYSSRKNTGPLQANSKPRRAFRSRRA